VIDNAAQVERLLAKLATAVPFAARPTPELAALIEERSPGQESPTRCLVESVSYAGDEGGIVCGLDLGRGGDAKGFFVSITHLMFDPRTPYAREIAAYQKHRIKRFRRLGLSTSAGAPGHEPW